MPITVYSAIELLKIIRILVGQPGIIQLYITEKDSVLIGNANSKVSIADVMAALLECRPDAEISHILYDNDLSAYKIVWVR